MEFANFWHIIHRYFPCWFLGNYLVSIIRSHSSTVLVLHELFPHEVAPLMGNGQRTGVGVRKAIREFSMNLPIRIIMTVTGLIFASPLPILATSQLGLGWDFSIAVILASDIIAMVLLAIGLDSVSRAAILASLMSSIYFLQIGKPDVSPWASLFASIKTPIYLSAGIIGLKYEKQPVMRWAGFILPVLAVVYLVWSYFYFG